MVVRPTSTADLGLTLVHFPLSVQRKHFLCVLSVTKPAQFETRSGRVLAPAAAPSTPGSSSDGHAPGPIHRLPGLPVPTPACAASATL